MTSSLTAPSKVLFDTGNQSLHSLTLLSLYSLTFTINKGWHPQSTIERRFGSGGCGFGIDTHLLLFWTLMGGVRCSFVLFDHTRSHEPQYDGELQCSLLLLWLATAATGGSVYALLLLLVPFTHWRSFVPESRMRWGWLQPCTLTEWPIGNGVHRIIFV